MNTIEMSFDIEMSVAETRALNRHTDGYGYSMTEMVKMLVLQFLNRQKEYVEELDELSKLAFEVNNKE